MDWRDEGFIIGAKVFQEKDIFLEIMTHQHGRYVGLVYGGKSFKKQTILQIGNYVSVVWRARKEEALGYFTVEIIRSCSMNLIQKRFNLYAFQLLSLYLRFLPETTPNVLMFSFLVSFFKCIENPLRLGEILARFELKLLEETGYGLELTKCAVTGCQDIKKLAYVSPKSGHSVTYEIGYPYRDRLFVLPSFLIQNEKNFIEVSDLINSLVLTEYFIDRYLWGDYKNIGREFRDYLIDALKKEGLNNPSFETLKGADS